MASKYLPTPQYLGGFSTKVAMTAPTSDTDGYALNGARYVNVYCQTAGGVGAMWQLIPYIYRPDVGWLRYREMPQTFSFYSSTNGDILQIEPRGAERFYPWVSFIENSPTAIVMLEGFT